MNALLVADLHLSSIAREEYRWKLFPWLLEIIPQQAVKLLVILGDLTEAKDYHSSRLVNRIVDALCKLNRDTGVTVIIVPGNHDGIDPGCPYFRFLGQFPFVRYMNVPFLTGGSGGAQDFWVNRKLLFLPHTKTPEEWREHKLLPEAEVIFMHQTMAGSKSETGFGLEGMAESVLAAARRAKIWSGDVHVPQVIGPVEYVGAPYPVRFGDEFKPRAVLLSNMLRKATDLETPHFARRSVIIDASVALDKIDGIQTGDQMKVRVRLSRAEFGEWGRISRMVKQFCEETGVELCGLEVERVEERAPKIKPRGSGGSAALTLAQVLSGWCERQGVEKPLAEAGQRILATVAK